MRARIGAGLRFAGFLGAVVLCLGLNFAALQRIPGVGERLERAFAGEISAGFLILLDSVQLAIVAGLTAIALRLERRPPASAGVPLAGAALLQVGEGLLVGLAVATLAVGMCALGGVSVSRGTGGAGSGAAWGLGFLLVAGYEELLFRGYGLARLAEAIGFWPAAAVLGALFGLVHVSTVENPWGLLNAAAFALLAAFAVLRTGGLWWAIGIHAAWNYGLVALYGVPSSGLAVADSILVTDFHGPSGWTGGTVGPEASPAGFLALAIAGLALHLRFPATSLTSG